MSGDGTTDPWRRLPTAGSRAENALNLVVNTLRSPSRLPTVVAKLVRRVRRGDHAEHARALEWCEAHVEEAAAFAGERDLSAWKEATVFAEDLRRRAGEKLLAVKYHLGGGGHYALLYFLVRVLRPEVVVETGVAAGWSSEAVLSALGANGHGTLHSSDFPMLRLSDPASYIGILVRPENRARWTLHTDGDAANLPRILASLGDAPIDLVHYDSDKTARGRDEAMRLLSPRLRDGTVIVMDDIQDDMFFARFADGRRFHVFRFESKFLGMIEWSHPARRPWA